MKLIIRILIGILVVPIIVTGQPKLTHTPIYIIKAYGSSEETVTRSIAINWSKIEKIRVLYVEEVKKRFGDSEKSTAVEIFLKPGAKVKTLKEFYDSKKVAMGQRNLPLTIDGQRIANLTDVLIEEGSIKSFSLATDSIVIKTSNKDELIEAESKKKAVH